MRQANVCCPLQCFPYDGTEGTANAEKCMNMVTET